MTAITSTTCKVEIEDIFHKGCHIFTIVGVDGRKAIRRRDGNYYVAGKVVSSQVRQMIDAAWMEHRFSWIRRRHQSI